MIRVKHLVCRAFPERIKTIPGDNRAKSVQKTHSTIHRLLSFAMLAVLVNSPLLQAMRNALPARPVKRVHPALNVTQSNIGPPTTTTLNRALFAKKDSIKIQVAKPFVIRVFQACTNPTQGANNAILALSVDTKIRPIKKFVKLSTQVMLLLVVARLQ